MAEVFVNDFQTTLNGSITSGTNPITVTAGTSEASQFRCRIDDEILIVTAGGDGTSWTVTRGAEGTSADAHNDGATVTVVLTDGALDNWMTEQLTTNITNTFAGILSAVYDWYVANNATNMDHKITAGDYIALIHHDTNATSGFLSPTTATHTVTTGRKAVILLSRGSTSVVNDISFRGMRLQNTTDTVTVIAQGTAFRDGRDLTDGGGGGDDAKLKEVAAGKVIELQTWNADANTRGRGGFVILKEIDV